MAHLFPDQVAALEAVEAALEAGTPGVLLAAATGFGKTHCAVEFIRRWHERGRRTWFLAHLAELLDDSASRLAERGLPFGWIRSGHTPDPVAPCQLVSLLSAARRLDDLPPADLVIIDECDLAVAPSYQAVLEALGRPQILGLTGSPIRLDGRPMRDGGFHEIIRTPDTIDLIEMGRLSKLRIWTFKPPPELRTVKRRGGELDPSQAGGVMSRPMILSDCFGRWRGLCAPDGPGGLVRPTAAFAHSVAAAETAAEKWRAKGFLAMAVSGQSSKTDRRRALEGLRSGELDIVFSADLWIAGVDVKRIACILCLRETESLRIWLQMVGRGLRRCDEWEDCLLLDLVGNVTRLGSPLARRMAHWTLDGVSPGGRTAAPPPAPVIVCQACRSCDVAGGVCRECGHEQQLRLAHGPLVVEGQLLELDPRQALRAARPMEPVAVRDQARLLARQARTDGWDRARLIRELTALGQRAGYKNPRGWAYHQAQLRQPHAYIRRQGGPVS